MENTKTDLSYLYKQKRQLTEDTEKMQHEVEAMRKKIETREQGLIDRDKEISEIKAKTKEFEDLASK